MENITRDALASARGYYAGSMVEYSNVLEENSGVVLGDEIESEAVEVTTAWGTYTIASLFSGAVSRGEEIFLEGENGEDFCIVEFELYVIAVTGNGKGVYNCDYTVFALDPIE